jgi:hypothetical protein
MAKKKQRGGKRKGAGRKVENPEGHVFTIAVSVPSGLMERLDALAKRRSWGRSAAVTQAIRDLLTKHG